MTHTSPVRVLVVGGSYGGIAAVLNLLNLSLKRAVHFGAPFPGSFGSSADVPLDIHIIDERDGYVHLIGCPLAFASNDYAPKIWRKFEAIPALQHPYVRWTWGSVVSIDTEALCARIRHGGSNEETIYGYDYLIASSGLRRALPVVPQSLTHKQYLLEASNHIHAVQQCQDGVIVIGGGAVEVEMAGELKLMNRDQKITLIHSRETLLSSEPLTAECSDLTIEALRDIGVELVLGQRVVATTEKKDEAGRAFCMVTLQNGRQIRAGKVMHAISRSKPTSSYLPESSLDEEGQVKINYMQRFLDGAKHDERHYAIGNMVAWSEIKRCGGAIAQGRIAAVNVYSHILNERFGIERSFELLPRYPP